MKLTTWTVAETHCEDKNEGGCILHYSGNPIFHNMLLPTSHTKSNFKIE